MGLGQAIVKKLKSIAQRDRAFGLAQQCEFMSWLVKVLFDAKPDRIKMMIYVFRTYKVLAASQCRTEILIKKFGVDMHQKGETETPDEDVFGDAEVEVDFV